jgi:2-hydroxy-6-oxonona-2,4-dienedioate hydrolase
MKMSHAKAVVAGLFAAFAATAIWVGSTYRTDIDRARARVATGSRVIATRCGDIEYAQAGDGPVVLVVHGAGGGFDQGMALAGSLVPTGHRVIAMSRFGYLRTPVPERASIAAQADAHACLLDALEVRSAAVIGFSAGAPSALEFALRHGERCTALVLVVPGWFPSPEAAPHRLGAVAQAVFERALRSDFAFWAFVRLFPSAATRAVLGTPPGVVAAASPAEQARVASILWDILPLRPRAAGLSLEGKLTVEPLSKPLELIKVPTLTISAEDDLYGTWGNAQFITGQLAHGRFNGYRAGGHLLVGHNDEVLATIEHFLQENSAAERR